MGYDAAQIVADFLAKRNAPPAEADPDKARESLLATIRGVVNPKPDEPKHVAGPPPVPFDFDAENLKLAKKITSVRIAMGLPATWPARGGENG